jgi:hypothetical protein
MILDKGGIVGFNVVFISSIRYEKKGNEPEIIRFKA